MKKRTGFEEKLGIEEEEESPVTLEEVNVVSRGSKDDLGDDYKKIREATIKTIIRTGEIIDESAINIKQGANGMMVKAYADLVKSMKDNTMALLEMHREIRKLEGEKKDESEEQNSNTVKTSVNEIIELNKERRKRSNS
jgi:hypothetical protein